MECCNLAIKSKVEHIWPLCYGKAKVPSSKLIVKEFALGIKLEKKFSKDVSWVAFIEETNTNQHSKFFKRWEKMHNQRKDMKGLNGALVKCEPQLEGEFDSKVTKYEIVETLQGVEQLLLNKEWNLKLGFEVAQLLQAASMELEASKLQCA
jgi:hypothetical protein